MTKFQNLLFIFFLAILFSACKSDKQGNFTLRGNIKNLKKGVVYLQKDKGKEIVNLDSVVINGDPNFVLKTDIDEPILLYLKLQKKDGLEHFIPFFADKGETTINTSLKNFTSDAKITGSKQQVLLDRYLTLMSDFNNKNLDLIKLNFESQQRNDSITTDSLQKQSQRLHRLKYAATINFALSNNNSEVAPYLALYEIPNTSKKYLDSIYNNLNQNIKVSHYGEILGDILKNGENK